MKDFLQEPVVRELIDNFGGQIDSLELIKSPE